MTENGVYMTEKVITVKGKSVNIYHYELFLDLLKSWKSQGMSMEEIEELILA